MHSQWIRKNQDGKTIVFIHGILSSGEKCWLGKSAFWPELLRDETGFENTGIYVFSYETGFNSGNYRIGDAADSLWEYAWNLDGVFENTKCVIFVCHSMGGIVVRRMIVQRQRKLEDKQLPVGLFLVASPSLGADYGTWLSLLVWGTKHTQGKALKFSQQNDWLNDLDKDFMNLKENPGFPLKGKELIEDKALIFKSLFKKQVVEPFSGARYFGESFKVPGSDHSTIAKPESSDAVQHRLLCRFIEDMQPSEKPDEDSASVADIPKIEKGRTMKEISQLKQIKIPLAEALLKCQGMMDRNTRDDIVRMLPEKIQTTMNRSDVARADVMDILNRCLEFSDGMESLMKALRFMETEDAVCMAGVKDLVYEE